MVTQVGGWFFKQELSSSYGCVITARRTPVWGKEYDALGVIKVIGKLAIIEPLLSTSSITVKDFYDLKRYLVDFHQCEDISFTRFKGGKAHTTKKKLRIKEIS